MGESLERRVEELEEALKPFAMAGKLLQQRQKNNDLVSGYWADLDNEIVTFGHLRNAASVLRSQKVDRRRA